jgi:hypothetical protein
MRGSLFNEPRTEGDCASGEVAMFFVVCNFTAMRRAALYAVRVAVRAAVSSSGGGIWGVSDPLRLPPIAVQGSSPRGSLTPHLHAALVRAILVFSVPSSGAPPGVASWPASFPEQLKRA